MSQTTRPPHHNSRYNAQIAGYICWQLTEGRSLRSICKAEEMPDQTTIFRWLDAHESFRQQYARAKELQAHVLADEVMEIADGAKGGTMEEINAARLRVDTRKWMAGKLLAKVYGDKLLHTGADGDGPVAVKLSLDYSLLSPAEMVTLRALIDKAKPKAPEPLMIEGEATDVE